MYHVYTCPPHLLFINKSIYMHNKSLPLSKSVNTASSPKAKKKKRERESSSMDETGPSILFSIRGFFTPTVLFVLLNLVIATIALTSRTVRRQNNQEPAADDQGRRSGPTGLDRVRSIGIFRFGSRDLPQPEPDHHTQQTHYHQDPPPSLLERVSSGLFGGFGSRETPQQPESDRRTEQTHYPQDTPPPSVLERVRSGLFGLGSRDIPQPEPDQTIHTQTHFHQHAPQSALERVRSGLFRVGSRDSTPQPETHHIQTEIADPEPEPEHYDMDHHFRRIQSESALTKPVMAAERGALRKLASALSWRAPDPDVLRRRPVAGREEAPPPAAVVEEEEGEEVDARADDFISRFKQQLKLQRLDSILRYKEMLTRGSAR